jgi:hypothetical protein
VGLACFIYLAHVQAICSPTNSDILSPEAWWTPDIEDCTMGRSTIEQYQRFDALVIISGVMIVLGAWVVLSRARRRTKRLIIAGELSVVVLVIVYAALLYSVR